MDLPSGTESRGERIAGIIREFNRQIVHIFSGIVLLAILWYLGRAALVLALLAFVAIGMCFLYLRRFVRIWPAERFLGLMERNKFDLGPAYYAAGLLFAASVLADPDKLGAVIVILAFGDGFSTIVGKVFGTHMLPYNRNKSLEGSAAFFISSLACVFFIGWVGAAVAFIAAFLESIDIGIDDNLVVTIPIVLLVNALI